MAFNNIVTSFSSSAHVDFVSIESTTANNDTVAIPEEKNITSLSPSAHVDFVSIESTNTKNDTVMMLTDEKNITSLSSSTNVDSAVSIESIATNVDSVSKESTATNNSTIVVPEEDKKECATCQDYPECQEIMDFSYPGGIQNRTEMCSQHKRDCHLRCIDRTKRSHRLQQNNTWIWPIGGAWIDDPEYCSKYRETVQSCFLDRYRWTGGIATMGSKDACNLLAKAGIARVHLIGDSLTRNLFHGLTRLLSGDYNFYFRPKDKSTLKQWVCHNKKVKIQCSEHNPRISEKTIQGLDGQPTLILYGVGNHAAFPQHKSPWRHKILNFQAYYQERWSKVFTTPKFYGANNTLIWVPPHYKMTIGQLDETNVRALDFLQETADYFGQQFSVPTLNTYTLTEHANDYLCRNCDYDHFRDGKRSCTYYERESCQESDATMDGYHYGRDINLWKAQMVMGLFQRRLEQETI